MQNPACSCCAREHSELNMMARGYAEDARAHAIASRVDSDRRPESSKVRIPQTQGILRMRASIRHIDHSAAACHIHTWTTSGPSLNSALVAFRRRSGFGTTRDEPSTVTRAPASSIALASAHSLVMPTTWCCTVPRVSKINRSNAVSAPARANPTIRCATRSGRPVGCSALVAENP